jgi:hypothetical protein
VERAGGTHWIGLQFTCHYNLCVCVAGGWLLMEPRVLHMLGKHCTTQLHPGPYGLHFDLSGCLLEWGESKVKKGEGMRGGWQGSSSRNMVHFRIPHSYPGDHNVDTAWSKWAVFMQPDTLPSAGTQERQEASQRTNDQGSFF